MAFTCTSCSCFGKEGLTNRTSRRFNGSRACPPALSLFGRQCPYTIQVQFPFCAPAAYAFGNSGSKLLVESKCLLSQLIGFECFCQGSHRLAHSRQCLAELSFQVSFHAARIDGLCLVHCPNTVRCVDGRHVAAKNLNPKFFRPFLLACLFQRLGSRSKYPEPAPLALSCQSGYRLSQGQCLFAVKAEALGNDRRP